METRVHLIFSNGFTTFGAEEAIWIENDEYYIEVLDPREAVIGVAEVETDRDGNIEYKYYVFDPKDLPEWAKQTRGDIVKDAKRAKELLEVITSGKAMTPKEMAREVSKLIDEKLGDKLSSKQIRNVKYDVWIEYDGIELEDLFNPGELKKVREEHYV